VARGVRGQELMPFRQWREQKTRRGMSIWHDFVDWLGVYPFEFAKPGDVLNFLQPAVSSWRP
jgi:hypothetical protein